MSLTAVSKSARKCSRVETGDVTAKKLHEIPNSSSRKLACVSVMKRLAMPVYARPVLHGRKQPFLVNVILELKLRIVF